MAGARTAGPGGRGGRRGRSPSRSPAARAEPASPRACSELSCLQAAGQGGGQDGCVAATGTRRRVRGGRWESSRGAGWSRGRVRSRSARRRWWGGGGAVPDRPSQPRRRARSLGRAEGPSERVLLGEGPSADWRLSWRPASVCSSLLRCRFLREGTVFSINVSSGTLQNGAQRAAPDLCLIWPLRCLERHLH